MEKPPCGACVLHSDRHRISDPFLVALSSSEASAIIRKSPAPSPRSERYNGPVIIHWQRVSGDSRPRPTVALASSPSSLAVPCAINFVEPLQSSPGCYGSKVPQTVQCWRTTVNG